MSTSLPAQRPRQTFPQISAVSWEHPADRAALQALRAVPGVDEVIRKTLALLGGERGVRRREVVEAARRFIVEHCDVVPAGQQGLGKVGADESGSAGDKGAFHGERTPNVDERGASIIRRAHRRNVLRTPLPDGSLRNRL